MDRGAVCYRRYLDGDDSGIVDIIRDYKDGLILYINGIMGNILLAEEIMEETFFKLVTKKPNFSGRSSFKTWLYSMGRNAAIDFLRKNSRLSPIEPDSVGVITDEHDIESEYLREEQKITLHKAMEKLLPDYRQVLYLSYFEGFSNGEISTIMGKNKRQIENLLYRAKNALKAELEKEGFVYEVI